MLKLLHLTGKELGRAVEKLGFVFSHQTGSHMVFKHEDGRRTTILYHSGDEIGPGLLNKIIKKDLHISREMFLELLK